MGIFVEVVLKRDSSPSKSMMPLFIVLQISTNFYLTKKNYGLLYLNIKDVFSSSY